MMNEYEEIGMVQDQNQDFKDLIDNHCLSFVMDDFGIIQLVNIKFSNYTGYHESELNGMEFKSLTYENSKTNFYKEIWSTISCGQIWHGELQIVKKDLSDLWLNSTITPIFDAKNHISGYHCVSNDITPYKINESKASAPTIYTEQYSDNLAHEIMTPLSGAIGILELIEKEKIDDANVNKIKLLEKVCDNLYTTVKDILRKPDEGKKQTVVHNSFNVLEATHEIIELIKSLPLFKQKELDLCLYFNENKNFQFFGDESKYKQIITNIINNAIKFTDSGYVNVYLDYEDSDTSSKEMHIKVVDTGVGIPSHEIQNIFNKNTKLSDPNSPIEGFGLGLSIVEELTKLMEGKVEVSSVEKIGSTFDVFIPMEMTHQVKEAIHKTDKPYKNADIYGDLKILIAEDNPINQNIISGILNKFKVKYSVVNDGLEAVDESLLNHYDVILMDINMPIKNGIDAAREIKKSKPNQLIFALTAEMNHPLETSYLEVMDGFILKPIKTKYLLDIFKSIKFTKV